ncbi:MAG: hypothetical protein ABIS00_04235, partial [Gemmatimonadales bacterium]
MPSDRGIQQGWTPTRGIFCRARDEELVPSPPERRVRNFVAAVDIAAMAGRCDRLDRHKTRARWLTPKDESPRQTIRVL